MSVKNTLRQSGLAYLGFAVGSTAMFWLPWILAVLYKEEAGIGFAGIFRLFGTHLFASILLAGAYTLLYAAHLLLRRASHPPQPFRLHLIMGAMAGGLFYLLLTVLGEHLWVMVLLIAAGVITVHYWWDRRNRGQEADWV